MRCLEDAVVNSRRVLVRFDGDVPVVNGEVSDNFRLEALLPTLHFLLNREAAVILIAHRGRPGGKADATLSLRPIYEEVATLLNKPIKFATTLEEASAKAVALQPGEVLGVENLRFWTGEEAATRTFGRQLADFGDVYVNESFATAHREAASVTAVTEFLPSYPGLTFERELEVLRALLRTPDRPFMTVLGGAKVADKLPTINYLVQHVDKILLGGGVANTFLAATGVDIKRSLHEPALIDKAKQLLRRYPGKLVLPVDYLWQDDMILDVGPKTVALFQAQLSRAKTVFWNGCLGKTEELAFTGGSKGVAVKLSQSGATTVVGGGDTVGFLDELGLVGKYSFVSTGGGAALAMLAGQQLPAVKALS